MMVDIKKIIYYLVMYSLVVLWGSVMFIRLVISMVKNRATFFQTKKREFPPKVLVDGWNHGRVTLLDVSLHYVSAGADDKPLMLMVHGFPEFWYSWRHQIKEFQKDYKVVAIDMRGFGESDKPAGKESYDVKLLMKDLAEIIPALGYKSCTLLAHDWGGVVAWRFAIKHPELVDKMIICNAPHFAAFMKEILGGNYKQMLKSWYMFAFQLPYLPEYFHSSNDYAAFEAYFRKPPIGCTNTDAMTDEDIEAWKYTFSQMGALTPPINYYRQNLWSKASEETVEIGKIQPPTLLIWGTHDAALSTSLAERSIEYCEHGTVKYVDGASHWVQQDRPDIVNQYIREFISQ